MDSNMKRERKALSFLAKAKRGAKNLGWPAEKFLKLCSEKKLIAPDSLEAAELIAEEVYGELIDFARDTAYILGWNRRGFNCFHEKHLILQNNDEFKAAIAIYQELKSRLTYYRGLSESEKLNEHLDDGTRTPGMMTRYIPG